MVWWERFYCWKRESPVLTNLALRDKKYIIENGFEIKKLRKSGDILLDMDGSPLNDYEWDVSYPYVMIKQEYIKEDRDDYGENSYMGKDKVVFISHPDFDILIGDVFIYNEFPYDVTAIFHNSHDQEFPTHIQVTARKNPKSSRYDNV